MARWFESITMYQTLGSGRVVEAPAFEAGRRWFKSNLPSHSNAHRKVARVADWRRLLTGWGQVLHERSNRSPSARESRRDARAVMALPRKQIGPEIPATWVRLLLSPPRSLAPIAQSVEQLAYIQYLRRTSARLEVRVLLGAPNSCAV